VRLVLTGDQLEHVVSVALQEGRADAVDLGEAVRVTRARGGDPVEGPVVGDGLGGDVLATGHGTRLGRGRSRRRAVELSSSAFTRKVQRQLYKGARKWRGSSAARKDR
jgi:hypothetical protein